MIKKMVSIYKVNGKSLEHIIDFETDNLGVGLREYLKTELADVYEIEKILESIKFHGDQFAKIEFNGNQILASDGKNELDL